MTARRISLLVVLLIAVGAIGAACGRGRETEPPGSEGGGSASSGGSAGDAGLSTIADFMDGSPPVYDGSTDCAPDGPDWSRRTCCDGVPCRGDCRWIEEAWTCVCGDTLGGCELPQACCYGFGESCSLENVCGGGPP